MTADSFRPGAALTVANLVMTLAPLLCGLWLLWTSLAEPFPDMGTWNSKRMLQLWLFPALMLAPLVHAQTRTYACDLLARLGRPVSVAILAFLMLGVGSALRLEHPGYPLADVAMLFLLALGCLVMATSRLGIGSRFDQLALCLVALTGIGVYLLELVAVAAYLGAGAQYSYPEALLRFGHPRMYNQVQTWTLPVLVLLPLVFPHRAWLALVTPVLIGMQWQIIFTTGARGTVISLACAMAVVALCAPRMRRFWLRPQLAGVLVGILLYGALAAFLRMTQPELGDFLDTSIGRSLTSSSGRLYLWQLALADAVAHPVLGVGPAMFACDTPYTVAGSPHSFPLQILGEWGAAAFLLLGTTVAILLARMLRAIRGADPVKSGDVERTRACLSIAVLAACIHACVSGIPIAPASQVTGMLVLGWIWALPTPGDGMHQEYRVPGGIAPALFLAGLVVAVSLLQFARAEWHTIELRTRYAPEYGVASPRFWWDGRVCLYHYGAD